MPCPVNPQQNLFSLVPEDILLQCFSFMDVSCLAALAQTSKKKEQSISELASREDVWFQVVNKRFNLMDTKGGRRKGNILSCRPKLYGGPTWKDAYRSMDVSNRLPKLRGGLRKKVTFAKGRTSSYKTARKSNTDQCVSMWCMINHTEDCTLRSTNERIYDDHREVDMENGTFIELQVAFQNTKSGFCNVDVDISKITLQMKSSKSGVNSYLTQRIERKGALSPKVIYRSIGEDITYLDSSLKKRKRQASSAFQGQRCVGEEMSSLEILKDDDEPLILTLEPFEFAVCSINVPLSYYRERGENMRYETCFLSRAVTICAPIMRRTSFCFNKTIPDLINEDVTLPVETKNDCLVAVAHFSTTDENVVWDNYMELPGGFMSLVDRSQL